MTKKPDKKPIKKASTDSSNLHPEARKGLEKKLLANIEAGKINKGSLILVSGDNWSWEFAKAAAKARPRYLSIGNAWRILIDKIQDCFEDVPYGERPTGELNALLDKEHKQQLCTEIVDYLESIPRTYTLYLQLFGSKDHQWGDIKVANGIDLIHVTDGHELLQLRQVWNDENATHKICELYNEEKQVFYPGNAVLKVQCKGFAADSTEDSAIADAISNDKVVRKINLSDEVASHLAGYTLAPRQEEFELLGKDAQLWYL